MPQRKPSSARLSLFFFNRPRKTALLWLILIIFGSLCYTSLLKREGFPPINTPYAIGQGTYLVNNSAKVDNDIARPASEFILKQSGVKTVQTQSFDNYLSLIISYNEGVNSESRSHQIQNDLKSNHILPKDVELNIEAYKFGFTPRGDNIVLAIYSQNKETSYSELLKKANLVTDYLKNQNIPLLEQVSVIDPYKNALSPTTGEVQRTQANFDRFGLRQKNQAEFYRSISIGILAKKDADILELDKQVRAAVDKLNSNAELRGYNTVISASFAPQINQQISELQKSLLEGLLAVLLIGSLVITFRASLITVVAMISVIAITNGVLYVTGNTLNTIVLFSLILGLALIVDDTIIMVEAIDAQRRKFKDANKIVSVATSKVSRAMIAATSVAILSFAPLLFVSGLLGTFIRKVPITIISALLSSLFVALIFIPFFARIGLLRKNNPLTGANNRQGLSANIEARIANFIS